MNAVSEALDAAPQSPPSAAPREALTEMQAFVQLDPLLAALCKEYADAKALRVSTQAEYGADGDMADMAIMMEDSAWCAMQTRYLELRAARALMAQAQRLMEQSRLELVACEKAAREADQLKTLSYLQSMAQQRKLRESDELAGWVLLWLILSRRQAGFVTAAPRYAFSIAA